MTVRFFYHFFLKLFAKRTAVLLILSRIILAFVLPNLDNAQMTRPAAKSAISTASTMINTTLAPALDVFWDAELLPPTAAEELTDFVTAAEPSVAVAVEEPLVDKVAEESSGLTVIVLSMEVVSAAELPNEAPFIEVPSIEVFSAVEPTAGVLFEDEPPAGVPPVEELTAGAPPAEELTVGTPPPEELVVGVLLEEPLSVVLGVGDVAVAEEDGEVEVLSVAAAVVKAKTLFVVEYVPFLY